MTIKEFAEKSKKTMIYTSNEMALYCMSYGIWEEYAEVEVEINKFGIYGENQKEKIKDELGDLAFYVYGLSNAYGYIPSGTTGECFSMEEHVPIIAKALKKTARDNNWKLVDPKRRDAFQYVIETLHTYILGICEQYDFTLEEVLLHNINKLADRAQRGTIMGDGDRR